MPHASYTCRPTPAHFKKEATELVNDLLDQNIISYYGNGRSACCGTRHFAKKPLALRLVVDYSHLNLCLLKDQPQVFPTGEEIR